MTEKELAALFEEIELRLIASLKRNLPAHKAWESDLGFNWSAWQADKIKALERFRKENEAIMREYRNTIQEGTRKLLEEQYREGEEREADFLSDDGIFGGVADDSFFEIFDEKIESLIEEAQGKETTVEKAALRMMDDVYRQTIVRADTALQTGSVTLQQAIELAVEDFARQGINCIEYRDGRRVNIADYVYMALKTSNTRANLLGGAKQRAALGIDTVRVSSYGGCSETCLPWQGGIYIDDVYGVWDGETYGNKGKSKSGKWYLLLSVAITAGLFHPNCRHTLTSYTENSDPSPQMDGEKIRKQYKLEQKQRAMERAIRKWKRLEAASDDPVLQKAYGKKVREAQKNLREFIEEHKDILRRDPWREKIYKQTVDLPDKSAIIRGAGNKNTPSAPGETVTKEYGYIPKEQQEQFINDFVKKYAKSDVEHMLIIDRDGYGYYVTSNLPDEVKDDAFANKMAGSYNIHTHPPEQTQFSFSTDADIPAFFADGTEVMEAVDYKYRYRFERPNVTFEEWEQVRAEVEQQISKVLTIYGYDLGDYEEMKEHITILETCKRLGIDCYTRWEI